MQSHQCEQRRRRRRLDQQIKVAALVIIPTGSRTEDSRPRNAITGNNLPQRFPVCPMCKEIYESLRGPKNGDGDGSD